MLSSCSLFLQNDWDAAQLVEAAGATLEAMSITDAQVIALSQRTVAQQDASNVLAPDSYQKRLARLLDGVGKINGMPVNYKVYKTSQINEFAVSHGYSPYRMCDALDKLVKLSSGSQASMVQKMFSSHPDSAERARRIRAKADAASRKK